MENMLLETLSSSEKYFLWEREFGDLVLVSQNCILDHFSLKECEIVL